MSKIIYLQCPTGISGDMFLGALVSLGVPLEYLIAKLNQLGIEGEYRLRAELVQRGTQQATKVYVDLNDIHIQEHVSHHGRHLSQIEQIIQKAQLPQRVESWSLAVFRNLAIAEGLVHGLDPQEVHFHEVGAIDAIVDIVGTCLGLDWLGIDDNDRGFPLLTCSEQPTGGGTIRAAHGQMAVPVPAVLKLWEMRGCPVYSNNINKELVTPTGAAIVTTLATDFGAPPPMSIKQVGWGAGSMDLPVPNILRLWLGHSLTASRNIHSHEDRRFENFSLGKKQDEESKNSVPLRNSISSSHNLEKIYVLQTQIDDLSPQAIGYVFEALFNVGALDVFTESIGMKKSRPGILLSVICHPEQVASCEAVLFRETTTLGVRRLLQERAVLQREIQHVETKYGEVRVKVAWKGSPEEKAIANVQPEFEDCAQIARTQNVSWLEIQRLALQTWYEQQALEMKKRSFSE